MTNDDFEWDDAKAAANFAKHGVTFEGACEAFNDPFALNWEDDTQDAGEQRFVTLGIAEGRLVFVAYTMRGDRIRIISARLPEPFERRRYHDGNEA
jgi:uncharacterized DUF497 family protein